MLLLVLSIQPWLILHTVRKLWRQFRQDSQALPTAVWSAWRRSLAIGFLLTSLLALGLTTVARGWVDRGLQAWDEQQLQAVIVAVPMDFAQGITWQSPGNLVGMLPIVMISTALAVRWSRPLVAATIPVAYGLQFAFAWIGWGLWNRSRPDLVAGGVAAPSLHSFPSGHALVVVTVYGLLTYLWWRSSRSFSERLLAIGVFIVWASLVCVSRLVLGAHWVSDVLAGVVIGTAWVSVVIWALMRADAAMNRSVTDTGNAREKHY